MREATAWPQTRSRKVSEEQTCHTRRRESQRQRGARCRSRFWLKEESLIASVIVLCSRQHVTHAGWRIMMQSSQHSFWIYDTWSIAAKLSKVRLNRVQSSCSFTNF